MRPDPTKPLRPTRAINTNICFSKTAPINASPRTGRSRDGQFSRSTPRLKKCANDANGVALEFFSGNQTPTRPSISPDANNERAFHRPACFIKEFDWFWRSGQWKSSLGAKVDGGSGGEDLRRVRSSLSIPHRNRETSAKTNTRARRHLVEVMTHRRMVICPRPKASVTNRDDLRPRHGQIFTEKMQYCPRLDADQI